MSNALLKTASVAILCLAASHPVWARDDALHLPLSEVLDSADGKAKLDGTVRFYLAGQSTPKVKNQLGSDVSNPKTNGFNKTPTEGCRWAALSALVSLQNRAKQLGANAVIDIVSFYKRKEFSSPTEYECHDGTFVTGVALKGTFVVVDGN